MDQLIVRFIINRMLLVINEMCNLPWYGLVRGLLGLCRCVPTIFRFASQGILCEKYAVVTKWCFNDYLSYPRCYVIL